MTVRPPLWRGVALSFFLATGLAVLRDVAGQEAAEPAKPPDAPAAEAPKAEAGKEAAEAAAPEPAGDFPYDKLNVPAILLDDSPQAKQVKRQLELKVASMLRGQPPLEDVEARREFDNYYTRYYFAVLTHPHELGNWPDRRQKFLKALMASSIPPNVHDHLVATTFGVMSDIARGNFHPAARHNAVLFIASLNTQEPVALGDQKRAPVPFWNALKFMVDEYNNPKQIDAVRLAALIGILRHVELDRQLPPESRRIIGKPVDPLLTDMMLALVDAKDPPAGRLPEGHAWMRRRALDILGQMGGIGENGKAFKAIERLLGDSSEPVPVRCTRPTPWDD